MRTYVTPRRIHLALLASLVPLAAGCGTAGLRDTLSLDPVATAATKTAKVSSVRVAFEGSFSGPWAGQQFGFHGNGAVDTASLTGAMHFSFDFPPAAAATLGTNPSMDMVIQSKHGFVMYMRSPLFARAVPGAKPWLKMDLTKAAALKGVDLSSLKQLNQADPMQSLRYFSGSATSRELGYDQVRGVFTKHYALTIDLDKLANGNKTLQSALKQLRGLMGTKLPAEAWIDEKGLLRKLTMNFTLAKTPDGPVRMSFSEELYGFGSPVHVTAPPASQVTDATKLLGR
jgi:hypothetical protein